MDIAYYISDLLGQQGELTVPNLGYFVQIRMAAYYDNHEKKFYPPHYSVQFDPQTIDEDDALANYITSVKNISLASAKYFIEKYIANLKSQAMVEDVPFAQLGSFSSDGLKLSFTSNPKLDDPAFFGYRPLEAYRIGEAGAKKTATQADELTERIEQAPISPVVESPAPIINQPDAALPEETEIPAEEYYEEERRGMSIWLIILIVLTVIVIALGALYKFRPDIFNKYIDFRKKNDTSSVAKPAATKNADKDTLQLKEPVIIDDSTAKKDTPITSAAKPDIKKSEVVTEVKKTEVKAAPPANKPATVVTQAPQATAPTNTSSTEPVKKGMWVIYSGSFNLKSPALKRIEYLKGQGFTQARLAKDKVSQAQNYKVILGAFNTRAEAIDAEKELLITNKIKSRDMSVEKY